jgi:hypothetical protein
VELLGEVVGFADALHHGELGLESIDVFLLVAKPAG